MNSVGVGLGDLNAGRRLREAKGLVIRMIGTKFPGTSNSNNNAEDNNSGISIGYNLTC